MFPIITLIHKKYNLEMLCTIQKKSQLTLDKKFNKHLSFKIQNIFVHLNNKHMYGDMFEYIGNKKKYP